MRAACARTSWPGSAAGICNARLKSVSRESERENGRERERERGKEEMVLGHGLVSRVSLCCSFLLYYARPKKKNENRNDACDGRVITPEHNNNKKKKKGVDVTKEKDASRAPS